MFGAIGGPVHRMGDAAGALLWSMRLLPYRLDVASPLAMAIAGLGAPSVQPSRRYILAAAVGAPLICATLGLAGLAVAPLLVSDSRLLDLEYIHARSMATTFRDTTGRWLGVQPGAMDPQGDFSDGYVLAADYKAGYVADPPEVWFDVLRALEDRHIGVLTIHGHNPLAIGRALIKSAVGQHRRGASGLTSQLARSLHRLTPGDSGLSTLRRKYIEFTDGARLYNHLGGPDGIEFKRWLAMHLPVAMGARHSGFGSEIRGIGLASLALWNRPVDELPMAEQAILAAAVRRHVLLDISSDGRPSERQTARWTYLKQRAAYGLGVAYGEGDPRVRRAMARLSVMPPPTPRLDPDLADLFTGDPKRQLRVAANPQARAVGLAYRELIQARGEIQSVAGRHYRARAVEATLSLDIARNLAFVRRVEEELERVETRLGPRLQLALTHGGGKRHADILLSVADGRGRVVRFFARGHDTVWSGGHAKHDAQGRFDPAREDRHLGSIAKVAAAAALAAAGDRPESRYCNQMVDGGAVRNHDGSRGVRDCRGPRASYSARLSFGDSKNLPIIWALRRVPESSIRKAARDLGLRLDAGISPRIALTLGLATSHPPRLHAMAAALMHGARGRQALSLPPVLVEDVELREPDGTTSRRAEPTNGDRVDVRYIFKRNGAARYVAEVLSAPTRRGGTLSGLGPWLQKHGQPPMIAKTGTTSTPTGAIRDKWVLIALEWKGEVYTILLLVGAADPRHPLGRKISGNHFAPLFVEVLNDIVVPRPKRVVATDGDGRAPQAHIPALGRSRINESSDDENGPLPAVMDKKKNAR